MIVLRLLLSAYLAGYLALSVPLLNQVWATGTHVTPEQWAYHHQLQQAGFIRHHGPAPESGLADPGAQDARALGRLPPTGPRLAAGTSSALSPMNALEGAPTPFTGRDPSELISSLALPRDRIPSGLPVIPLEPPPR